MIYHFIGDSHASVFSGVGTQEKPFMQFSIPYTMLSEIPGFISYNIGAATAYNLYNKLNILEHMLTCINKVDYVFLCFGEVDCRAHLIKQADLQNKPIEEIIEECVDRYFRVPLYMQKMGYNVGIWGPIASTPDELKYPGPLFGTNIQRNMVTNHFTKCLQKLCEKHKIPLLSIFVDMLDEHLNTNPYYIMDHIHLSQTAMPLIRKRLSDLQLTTSNR